MAPSFSSYSRTKNSISLNWNKLSDGPSEGFSSVLGYYVYKNNGAGGNLYDLTSTITSKTTTTTTIPSLTSYTTYMFRISAYNIYGASI